MQMRGEKDVYVPKLKGRKFIKVLLRLLEVCNTHFWQGESRFFFDKNPSWYRKLCVQCIFFYWINYFKGNLGITNISILT